MKGIILAGGHGSRLAPMTTSTSKQLLPVYDKPMIYYPMSVLMRAGIKEVLIITTLEDQARFINLLGDGEDLGVHLEYVVQREPKGLAEAFILGRNFIGSDAVTLILGDNLFYGDGLSLALKSAISKPEGASIFSYYVENAERYGVVDLDENGRPRSIEEKPVHPKSNLAVTGLYVYDNDVVQMALDITPSKRNELEITDINRLYFERGDLRVEQLGREVIWLDTGTPDALLEAGELVRSLQHRQGLQIACLEEISYRNGWIDDAKMSEIGNRLNSTEYGQYILKLLNCEES